MRPSKLRLEKNESSERLKFFKERNDIRDYGGLSEIACGNLMRVHTPIRVTSNANESGVTGLHLQSLKLEVGIQDILQGQISKTQIFGIPFERRKTLCMDMLSINVDFGQMPRVELKKKQRQGDALRRVRFLDADRARAATEDTRVAEGWGGAGSGQGSSQRRRSSRPLRSPAGGKVCRYRHSMLDRLRSKNLWSRECRIIFRIKALREWVDTAYYRLMHERWAPSPPPLHPLSSSSMLSPSVLYIIDPALE